MNQELKNNLFYSENPSDYFFYLQKSGKISHYPELSHLIITPQDPAWHPEGSVWHHTLLVIDVAAQLKKSIDSQLEQHIYMLSALTHDIGKPYTTFFADGRWRSPGHDSIGLPALHSFLRRIDSVDLFDMIAPYVKEHLKPAHLFKVKDQVKDKAILRLHNIIPIDKLVHLARADHWGRLDPDAFDRIFPAGDWLLSRYNEIINRKSLPKPLLTGDYLINIGIIEGKQMGKILKSAYRLQLEGKFSCLDEIDAWLKTCVLK